VGPIVSRLRGRALDRRLIDGADPTATPQLAAHAARITRPSMRAALADHLERLARAESQAWTRWRVHPYGSAVRVNAKELRALAALLRGSTPMSARGVAMLRTLVVDGTGPAYTDRHGSALAHQLRTARTAACG